LLAEGGSIRLVMDGDALARLSGGEEMGGGGGAVTAAWGFDSKMPPRMGSYLCPELEGRGVEGAALM
jgi:hypothetical protein